MRITDLPSDSKIVAQLRESLQTLSASTTNGPLAKIAGDMLSGKRDMLDILQAPGVVDAMKRGQEMYKQRMDALSPEQREEFARQAQAQGDDLLASDPLLRATRQARDRQVD